MHNGVETIALSAFAGVTQAPYIEVPSTVNNISSDAFKEYTGIVTFHDKKKSDFADVSADIGLSDSFRTIEYNVSDGILTGVTPSWNTSGVERLVFPSRVRGVGN